MSADDQTGPARDRAAGQAQLLHRPREGRAWLREGRMSFKLTEQQIKVLNSSSGTSDVPLKALAVDMTIKMLRLRH